jgi:hypothetical protein
MLHTELKTDCLGQLSEWICNRLIMRSGGVAGEGEIDVEVR